MEWIEIGVVGFGGVRWMFRASTMMERLGCVQVRKKSKRI